MFEGLISALNTFAESLSEGGMSNFEFNSIRFTIKKVNHFIFIANSSNDIKTKKVMKQLRQISKNFFNVYPEEVLKNWNKNIRFLLILKSV